VIAERLASPSHDRRRIRNLGAPTDTHRTRPDNLTTGGLMAENELLTPSEVAEMFRVNPKTVTRWARAGRISAVRTLGGHRRFRAAEIRRFLEKVQDHQA
jgi:excisionase family DNA binding protein